MPKKILVISPFLPDDNAHYAGSKILNFYLKKIAKEPDFELKFLCIASTDEVSRNDLKAFHIDHTIAYIDNGDTPLWKMLVYNWINIFNFFAKTYGLLNGYYKHRILNELTKLKKQNYTPDIITLEWTQILLMVADIRKIFPDALYAATEHDIAFQSFERHKSLAKGTNKLKNILKGDILKQSELTALGKVDIVITFNKKDSALLHKHGIPISKTHEIAPWFTNYGDIVVNSQSKNIIFFGAMNRSENYKSVIWFIENVFSNLQDLKLIIIGASPHESLKKFEFDRIIITGFVEDVRPYFENALCMVAPLILGAGIKIKVLESLSSGLPVLTNNIGIEGIPATDGIHYLHCEKPDDYIATIRELISGVKVSSEISKNAKQFMNELFDMEKSYLDYKKAILDRLREKPLKS